MGKKVYKCDIRDCEKLCSSKFSLKRHYLVHLNQKKHVCQHCQKAFALPQYLEEHEYTHTGARPFVCGINGCTEQFRQRGKLSIHKKNQHPPNQQVDNGRITITNNLSNANNSRFNDRLQRLEEEEKEEEEDFQNMQLMQQQYSRFGNIPPGMDPGRWALMNNGPALMQQLKNQGLMVGEMVSSPHRFQNEEQYLQYPSHSQQPLIKQQIEQLNYEAPLCQQQLNGENLRTLQNQMSMQQMPFDRQGANVQEFYPNDVYNTNEQQQQYLMAGSQNNNGGFSIPRKLKNEFQNDQNQDFQRQGSSELQRNHHGHQQSHSHQQKKEQQLSKEAMIKMRLQMHQQQVEQENISRENKIQILSSRQQQPPSIKSLKSRDFYIGQEEVKQNQPMIQRQINETDKIHSQYIQNKAQLQQQPETPVQVQHREQQGFNDQIAQNTKLPLFNNRNNPIDKILGQDMPGYPPSSNNGNISLQQNMNNFIAQQELIESRIDPKNQYDRIPYTQQSQRHPSYQKQQDSQNQQLRGQLPTNLGKRHQSNTSYNQQQFEQIGNKVQNFKIQLQGQQNPIKLHKAMKSGNIVEQQQISFNSDTESEKLNNDDEESQFEDLDYDDEIDGDIEQIQIQNKQQQYLQYNPQQIRELQLQQYEQENNQFQRPQ